VCTEFHNFVVKTVRLNRSIIIIIVVVIVIVIVVVVIIQGRRK